jgi:hypothetical protein
MKICTPYIFRCLKCHLLDALVFSDASVCAAGITASPTVSPTVLPIVQRTKKGKGKEKEKQRVTNKKIDVTKIRGGLAKKGKSLTNQPQSVKKEQTQKHPKLSKAPALASKADSKKKGTPGKKKA